LSRKLCGTPWSFPVSVHNSAKRNRNITIKVVQPNGLCLSKATSRNLEHLEPVTTVLKPRAKNDLVVEAEDVVANVGPELFKNVGGAGDDELLRPVRSSLT